MKKIVIYLLIGLFSISTNAQNENKEDQLVDIESISFKGLDKSVKNAFQETKNLILESRNQKDQVTESDATSKWCLMLHNYDFLKEAKTCYFIVGQKDKESAKWPYLFAKASSKQEDIIMGLKETLKREPIYLPAHYHLIEMQLQAGNFKSAFELLNQVPVEIRLAQSILKLTGDLYFETKNYYIAIGYFQQILKQTPEAGSLNYKIAQAYLAMNDQVNAESYISKSNSIGLTVNDPYYQEVKQQTVGEIPFLIKAKRAFLHKQYNQAIESYNKALEFNPSSISGLVNLAVSYYHNQQIEQAKVTFEKVLQIDSNQETALYNLATISLTENQYTKAITLFEKYLILKQDDAEVIDKLIELYYQTQQYEKVVNLIDGIKEESKYLYEKSKALVQLGEFESSIKVLETILEKEPNDIKSLLSLAKIYSQVPLKELRDGEKAVYYSEKALDLHKSNKSYWSLIHSLDEANQCSKLTDIVDVFSNQLNISQEEVFKELQKQRQASNNCN